MTSTVGTMSAPAPEATTAPGRGSTTSTALWISAVVVLAALSALVVIVIMCIVKVVQGDENMNGITEAVSLITASGAILTGLVGTFFGVNVAHRAQNLTEGAQAEAQAATQQASRAADIASRNSAAAMAAMSALDPNNPAHREVISRVERFLPSL
jgi:hypothetical protein